MGGKAGLRKQNRQVYYQYEQSSKFEKPNWTALQYSRVLHSEGGILTPLTPFDSIVLVGAKKEGVLNYWWRTVLLTSVLILEIHCNFTHGSKVMDTHNCGTGPTTGSSTWSAATASACYCLIEKDSWKSSYGASRGLLWYLDIWHEQVMTLL